MTTQALALVLLAAFLHAGWNFLAKWSRDTLAFLWWGVALGAVGYGAWLVTRERLSLAPGSWLYFGVSALAEFGYFVTLARGYELGDLSLVYPLSRGSAPIYLSLWSALLLAERLPWLGYLGLALMIVGVYVASFQPLREMPRSTWRLLTAPLRDPAARWALTSGLFISVYSITDKLALVSTPPLVYNWWVYAGNALLWSAIVWRRSRLAQNWNELRTNWLAIIAGAAMTVGAYLSVLVSLSVTSASYVVAGRGLSVVIGALLGTLVLKEGFGSARIIGAGMLVVGLVAISLA